MKIRRSCNTRTGDRPSPPGTLALPHSGTPTILNWTCWEGCTHSSGCGKQNPEPSKLSPIRVRQS